MEQNPTSNRYSKHVYLLNKTIFSGDDSYLGTDNVNCTQEGNTTKMLNNTEYADSQFPTEKKDFKSKINPHILKRNDQKQNWVWFGTYIHWISNHEMAQVIQRCPEDTSMPTESAAIHLRNYDVVFESRNGTGHPVLVKNEESGVCLIKIYLIKKTQLEYLIHEETKVDFKGKPFFWHFDKLFRKWEIDQWGWDCINW